MKKILLNLFCLLSYQAISQQMSMKDMSFWKNSGKTNWSIVQSVKSDLNVEESMTTEPGIGILANLPVKDNNTNLESILEHGDADIFFDFRMVKHSNSGLQLQGRFEVQLLDSCGVINPHTGYGQYAKSRSS